LKLISNAKIGYSILIWVFVSLLIHQQVYTQQEYLNDEYNIKLEYHNDWKVNKEIKSTINSENTESLNKKINDVVYSGFNHFSLLHIIPDVEKNGYESTLIGDTIISITLYPNMTSLEDTRVYQNMTSLEDTRVYQNMTSLEDTRVYQNMTSLEDTRVYQNMTSLGQ
jgi:hypothetical protein